MGKELINKSQLKLTLMKILTALTKTACSSNTTSPVGSNTHQKTRTSSSMPTWQNLLRGRLLAVGLFLCTLAFTNSIQAQWVVSTSSHPTEGSTGTITVTWTGGNVGDRSVDLTITGDAVDGTDYTSINGGAAQTITIDTTSGPQSQDISVVTTDDSIVEEDESVVATLSSPSDSATLDSSSSSLDIIDNDSATYSIDATDDAAGEPTGGTGGTGTYTVSISDESSTITTLSYSVTGTANSGADFTALSGTVSIAAGDTSETITLNALDDTILEGDETVIVTLTGKTAGDDDITASASLADTVTIDDGDTATVTINASKTDAVEDGTDGSWTVEFSDNSLTSSSDTIVNVSLGGSSTAGTDFANFTTVTIPAGDSSVPVTIDPSADDSVEGTETAELTLDSIDTSNASITGVSGAPVSLDIADAESASVEWASTTGSTDEDSGPGSVNAVLTTSPVTATLAANLTIEVDSADGSATQPGDYTQITAGILTFSAGDGNADTASQSITINSDTLVEGDETLTLTLSNPSANGSLGTDTLHTHTINDAESVSVQLTATSNTLAEAVGADQTVFTAQITTGAGNTLQDSLTVEVTFTNGTAESADYTLNIPATSGGTLTFANGSGNSATQNIVMDLVDDALVEDNDTLTVALQNPDSPMTIGTNSSGTLTITSEDTGTISISKIDGDEATPSSVRFLVSSTAESEEAVTLNLTVGGTAASPADYAAIGSTFVLPANDTSELFDFAVVDDTIIEADETVSVTVDSLSGPSDFSIGTASAEAMITDNDSGTVQVAAAPTDGAEPGTDGVFTFEFSTAVTSSTDTVVSYALSGVATEGDDYATIVTKQVTIPAGDSDAAVTIDVSDDSINEGTSESVIITPGGALVSGDAEISVNLAPGTLDITDNDSTEASITNVVDGSEGGNANLTVTLDNESSVDTTVNYGFTANTATGGGTDYTDSTTSIVISAGDTTGNITVPLVDDLLVEGTEDFSVALTSATGNSATVDTASNTVDITDTDSASVAFTLANSSVAEAAANHSVGLTLTTVGGATLQRNLDIDVTSADGTATAGNDYTALAPTTVQFLATNGDGATTSVDVPVLDDSLVELDETLTLSLSESNDAVTTSGTHTVTIEDPDTATVEIATQTNGIEGTTDAVIRFSINNQSSQDTTVNYTVPAGDFGVSGSQSTTISANTSSVDVTLSVTDDNIIEPLETHNITLDSVVNAVNTGQADSPAGVSVGATDNDDVTITDNDSGSIQITAGADAAEPSTSGTFTVAFENGVTSAADTEVNLSDNGGTAVAGNDFTLPASVTISANTGSATLTIPVIDDATFEGDETINVLLQSVVQAGITVGSPSSASITLRDDEELDWGDAPTAYPVTNAEDGARHQFSASINGPNFGADIDGETDGQESANADGDDNNGSDDEDGVGFLTSPMFVSSSSTTTGSVVVDLNNAAANANNYLNVWIDLNQDGDWEDADEQLIDDIDLGTTDGTFTLSFTLPQSVAGNIVEGTTYARFRVSSQAGLEEIGLANDGEVEDIAVELAIDSSTGSGSPVITLPSAATRVEVDPNNLNQIQVVDSNGDVLATIPTNAIQTELIINGLPGTDDQITIDLDNMTIPTSGITFNGGAGGNDELIITGGVLGTTTIDLTGQGSGNLDFETDGNNEINFTGLEPVDTTGSTINNLIFNINASTTDGELRDSGANSSLLFTSNSNEDTVFATPSGSLTINLQGGNSDVDLFGLDSDGTIPATVTLDGQSGDGFDYQNADVFPDGSALVIGSDVDVDMDSNADTVASLSGSGALIDANLTTSGDTSTTYSGAFSGSITKQGAGVLTLSGTSTGTVNVAGGSVHLSGTAGEVNVQNGGTLLGNATITGNLNSLNGGTVQPGASPGTMNVGGLDLDAGSTLEIEINGTTPGSQYDQIVVTGAVDITGATLSLSAGFTPTSGTTFTIIDNDLVDAVTGTFAGLAEGDLVNAGGTVFSISYMGGTDSNDVVLTAANGVTLSTDSDTLSETIGATARITATLAAAVGEDVFVTLGFSGTATNAADYTRTASFILIPSGSTSGFIDVTNLDDLIDEADETIIVDITAVTTATPNLVTEVGTQTETITIIDNDNPSVSISLVNNTISNESGTVTVRATTSAPVGAGQTVTVNLAFTGTATFGTDYTTPANAMTIDVTAGNTTGDLVITAVNDVLNEVDETIIIGIDSATGASIAAPSSVSQTLVDDDAGLPDVTITSNGDKDESTGSLTYSVDLSAATGQDVVVGFTYSGTATAGTDYTTVSSVTILAGSTSGTLSLPIIDDNLFEGSESVIVDIDSVTNANEGSPNQATANITETDTVPNVDSLTVSPNPVDEGAGTLTVTANLNKVTVTDVTMDISYIDGTATSPADYDGSVVAITIPAGSSSGSLSLPIVDDADDENDETFSFGAIAITSGGNATATGTASPVVTITDNDDPIISITVAPAEATEGVVDDAFTFTVSLDSAPVGSATVNIQLGGTATNTVDYNVDGSLNLTFNNATPQTFTIDLLDDALDEADETIIASVSSATGATVTGSANPTATATIKDDENPNVFLSITPGSVDEAAGTATLTATLSATTPNPVIVNLDTTGGEAVLGSDFSLDSSITIPANTMSASITLTAIDDSSNESDETVVIDIDTVNGADESGVQQAQTVITDNDSAPSVTLSTDVSTIAENGGAAVVTATLSGTSGQDVTVNLAYSGTAINATDYTSSSAVITITAGNLTGTVNLTGQDDTADEDDETIIVDIDSVVNGTENGVQQQTVTITDDDDAPTVTLSINNASIPENGGVATITATLNTASGKDVTVNVAFSGSATENVDYTPSGSSISIPAGDLTGSITVTGIDDAIDEANEDVDVAISSTVNATAAGSAQMTFVLDDDAAPTVTLTTGPILIEEEGPSSTIVATLSAISGQDVTVDLTNLSGTATLTDDYTLSSNSITIPAGSLSGTASLIPVNDAIQNEGDETVVITVTAAQLTNATPAGGASEVITVTIEDNDNTLGSAVLSFTGGYAPSVATSGSIAINPTDTLAIYSVQLPVPAGWTASNISNGGSFDGTNIDWTNLTGVQTLTFELTPPALESGDKILTATVTIPGGTFKDSAILSEFGTGIVVSESTLTVSESGTTASFTIHLSAQPVAPVSIGVSSSDSTEAQVNVGGVFFSTTNFNTPQTIIVRGIDDPFVDGDQTATIVVAPAQSADPLFAGADGADIAVTVTDDEGGNNNGGGNNGGGTPGITVTPLNGLSITEGDATQATFTVVLDSAPAAAVSIGLSSGDLTEGQVTTGGLFFTSSNWNVPQTVGVFSLIDNIADGDQTFNVVVANAFSFDSDYNGLFGTTVEVTNLDIDGGGSGSSGGGSGNGSVNDPHPADTNADGVITSAELSNYYQANAGDPALTLHIYNAVGIVSAGGSYTVNNSLSEPDKWEASGSRDLVGGNGEPAPGEYQFQISHIDKDGTYGLLRAQDGDYVVMGSHDLNSWHPLSNVRVTGAIGLFFDEDNFNANHCFYKVVKVKE